jgi:capsular exopolysaccharide synthesis family protein
MAAILAISGKKVLLMGLDLRKPKLHEELNLPADVGISKLLIGKSTAAEVIFKTKIENLDVLPAGPIPPNPSELIMSDHMKNLLLELRQEYDYIIIDTPPIGLVTDALIAMKYADVSLYVFRQKYSKKVYLETLNKLHSDNSVKNLAIVLNDLRLNKSYGYYNGYGHKYGYGYGYGYYEEENNNKRLLGRVFSAFGSLKNIIIK